MHFLDMMSLIHFLISVPLCSGHSWLLQIGDRGLKRGGLEGDDLAKTRYYCPFDDLSKCVAPNSAVVLPPDVRRPCEPGKSVPMATATVGGPLYLGWQGNGHVQKPESNGSCVSVSIAPYASDPNVSDFKRLVDCAPFNRGWSPDMTLTLPASQAPGEYTIWWLWHFAGFYYSSCADVSVSSGQPVPPAKKLSITEALALPYDRVDCATVEDPDGFCINKFGLAIPTYCKKYSKNSCGFSVCQGYDVLDPCISNSTNTTAAPTTSPLSAADLSLPLEFTDCRRVSQSDEWCRQKTGSSRSYCKSWSGDSCGRAHCFGYERPKNLTCFPPINSSPTDSSLGARSPSPQATPAGIITPPTSNATTETRRQVGCEAAPKPHEYCRIVFGRGSYCKLDQRDRCGRSWCFGQLTMPSCRL